MTRSAALLGWCLMASLVASPVLGQAAETKIAFVDLGRAFDDYEKTKRLDKQLEERSNAKQAERDQLVAEIRKMKDEIELMSEKGREDRQTALDGKIQHLQQFDQQVRETLKHDRDDAVKGILKEIETVVQSYAKSQGYDFVLSDRALLYGVPTADITDQILKLLNNPPAANASSRSS